MGRGGFSRPAAGALGPRLAAALLAGALAMGCGASGSGGTSGSAAATATARTGTATPSPRATSAEEVCVALVTHWSRKVLDGTTYGDYQSMGLSNGQYDILRAAVEQARPVRERQGTAAAHEVIDRQVREACAERHRGGRPSQGPWR
ncbi:hypothetical protein ACFYOV_00355 [Streptomyces sp. NPDC005931]|uniref:hypothetical protein n=1 Tax=Streptomyces sp. NPDC005931 TaxID=3364737 RepID=UPI0036CE5C51